MKKLYHLIYWLLLPGMLWGQPIKADFDEIWNSGLVLPQKLKKVDSLAMLMDAYFYRLPIEELSQARQIAKDNNWSILAHELELSLGIKYIELDEIDTAQMLLEPIYLNFLDAGYKKQAAQTALELLWIYIIIPDYDKAIDYGLKALQLFQELKDVEYLARTNGLIGFCYIVMDGDIKEKALPYFQNATKDLEQFDNPKLVGKIYRYLGMYYELQKDTVKALESFNNSIAELDKLADKSHLSGSYIDRGNFYKEMGEYLLAEKDFHQAKKFAQSSGYLLNDIEGDRDLGHLYLVMKKYQQAIFYFEKALEYHEGNGDEFIGDLSPLYKDMAIAYAEVDSFEKAYYYMTRYEVMEDSMYKIEANRNIADMDTKYQTAQKEALLAQKEREQYFLFSILGGFFFLAGTLWWGFNNKKRTNKILLEKNEQKEFLIKEIHHRVKNNLQVLSSLLSLQSDYIQDAAALDAVIEGRNRVQSMGLLHQKLYTEDNLAAVDMGNYIQDLTAHLLDTFGTKNRVQIEQSIKVVPLDIDSAIPIGLIINELVTNSLKYAFPAEQKGKIKIELWESPDKTLCLIVKDDGVGKRAAVNHPNATSFGTDLIAILSQKLKGEIQANSENGYETIIRFQKYELGKTFI